jgi:hypothetical protein
MVHYAFFPILIFAAVAIKVCMVGALVEYHEERRVRQPAVARRRFFYSSAINGVGVSQAVE